MLAHRLWRHGWIVFLLAGCDRMPQLLPPPPPPAIRTAPPVVANPTPPKPANQAPGEDVPRTADSAPDEFQVEFKTTQGTFVVDVHRSWAPRGADRFYQLVKQGYYDGCKFFRVMPGFIVQWGMHGNPEINKKHQKSVFPDDKFSQSNQRGTVVFATSGPNTRTTQLFVNLGNNGKGSQADLDSQNFTPFGEVTRGLEDVVEKITSEYGEQPSQLGISSNGNTYLDERFPNLDYIIKAKIVKAKGSEAEDAAPSTSTPEQPKEAAAEQPAETPPDSPSDARHPANVAP
jgi:cyclophilin family peptidyl-prolyl cis-trans isomerase